MIQEFIDQVLRSKEAKTIWRSFYSVRREKIWISEFEQSAKREALQREWQELINKAYHAVASMQATGAKIA